VRARCRRRRWRALNTTSVLNHLDGWQPHADDQAMHVAEGCVHHYVTLAKSRKHQTFVEQVSATYAVARMLLYGGSLTASACSCGGVWHAQRHEARARDRQASASPDAQQQLAPPSPLHPEPTSSSVQPSLPLAATSPPEGSAAATGTLQPLRVPPNMIKPLADERFAKFRWAPFCAPPSHGPPVRRRWSLR
jgi:hypothetical protein